MLGIAAKHNIKTDLKELLDPMLAMGLSPTLTIALKELAVAVPALKKDISEGKKENQLNIFTDIFQDFFYFRIIENAFPST